MFQKDQCSCYEDFPRQSLGGWPWPLCFAQSHSRCLELFFKAAMQPESRMQLLSFFGKGLAVGPLLCTALLSRLAYQSQQNFA